jgi:hypothetical protein
VDDSVPSMRSSSVYAVFTTSFPWNGIKTLFHIRKRKYIRTEKKEAVSEKKYARVSFPIEIFFIQ